MIQLCVATLLASTQSTLGDIVLVLGLWGGCIGLGSGAGACVAVLSSKKKRERGPAATLGAAVGFIIGALIAITAAILLAVH